MPTPCPEKSIACRVKALELGATGGDQHPPAVLTYGGPQFTWDTTTQTGNIPIFSIWTFEGYGPAETLTVTGNKVYLHHAPMGMLLTAGIRVSSPFPGSNGLEIQIYSGGNPMLASPLALTGATQWIDAQNIIQAERTILAGEILEVEITAEPPGYGSWAGLVVDFCGVIDPNSASAGNPPFSLLAPQISGFTAVGSLLTGVVGSWQNSPTSFLYQWYVNGVAVPGETTLFYTIQPADAGLAIQMKVTATNADGSTTVGSNIITADAAPGIPTIVVNPVVSGTPVAGSTLTTTTGTWTNTPLTYSYQWYKDGVAIPGAVASTYLVQVGDTGSAIRAEVVATNGTGSSTPAASNTVNITTGTGTIYYGRSALGTLDSNDVTSLGGSISAIDPAGSYAFGAGSGYYYFAVPVNLPEPVTINLLSSGNPVVLATQPDFPDYNGLTTSLLPFDTVFVVGPGINYRVFRSYNTLAGADSIVITT